MKKQADKIKRIGLIGNSDKAVCAEIIRKAAQLIKRAGRKAVVDGDIATLARESDLLLVFGGDGTMLRAAREGGDKRVLESRDLVALGRAP